MSTIWLNHWFSTAYNIINLIRQDNPDFRIIGTNDRRQSPIMKACDEWYQEPIAEGMDYVDYCLNFCKEHGVDVFMPRRELITISRHKKLFTDNGIKVMVDDFEYVDALNKKHKAYELFKEKNIGIVPDYFIVTDVDSFRNAYSELSKKYSRICFKFVWDEGGNSFHLIDVRNKGCDGLFRHSSTRISLEDTVAALTERETFAPLMVMPYLPDEEISVDCLRTASGIIAIPRIKGVTRIEKIRYDENILAVCHDLLEKIPLEMPCNIQFKYFEGVPYILEVNTRMSGGVQMSCLASGVNIPSVAVNKLLGKDIPWTDSKTDHDVTYIEIPMVL